MDDLIKMLEAAEGSNRELDERIMDAVYGPREVHLNLGGQQTTAWKIRPGVWMGIAPEGTRSLDAALTLIPEGFEWMIRGGWAKLWRPSPDFEARIDWEGSGATPAIALCIAALKARYNGN